MPKRPILPERGERHLPEPPRCLSGDFLFKRLPLDRTVQRLRGAYRQQSERLGCLGARFAGVFCSRPRPGAPRQSGIFRGYKVLGNVSSFSLESAPRLGSDDHLICLAHYHDRGGEVSSSGSRGGSIPNSLGHDRNPVSLSR